MRRITWLFTDEAIDEKAISAVEKSFRVRFPDDYRECVKKYNGGYPEPNVYDINADEGGAVFDCLLSFTNKDANIEVIYDVTPLPEGIIPFARDPFGGLICFNYRNTKDSPTVVFYDQESVNDDKIKLICGTFSELIDRLYSDEDI
ncbi:SMI1/KNR4 family protein [Paenibacillus sp. MMS18-CY102]|uniref:SMI1/KNR4 family protein n=1 Tax=Paenibacillus sp. MMS18-CY102 TaxID=2682849 RepID=UPI001365558C|nr:SMI1/KNR4 family protein [Paenibacillus sp. MMS18-CY102]MWC31272.1 SMI1/KNR4 family protein [Paenibacillus sp. MMS18-CY102]